MSGDLRGTRELVRLALRRDRWLLPAWVLGFAAIATSSASATAALYPDPAARFQAATTVNATAAIVAMYGRIYDPASLGGIALFKLTAVGTAIVAILMVVLVVRHTRAEEESGRLELVGAGVVGRAAPLAAALLVAAGASAALGVCTAVGLVSAGLPAMGALAFGAGWAAVGMCFAAMAGVAAQVTTGGRAATGLGLIAVGAAYVLRAVGDLSEAGPGWASWLSPIGWNQQIRAFAGERWGVLALPLLAAAALVPVAFALCRHRDLGAGLLGDRPGPADGRLGTPLGLAWRLKRPALLAWSGALMVLGGVLGSIAHNVAGLLDSPGMAAIIEQLGGKQGLTDAFLAAEMGVIATIVAAYGIAAAGRLRAEETAGHDEIMLSTAAGRGRVSVAHWLVALAGVAWLLLVAGFAAGVGHALAIGDPSQVARVTIAAAARVPGAWVLVGLVVTTWGVWPRATAAVWGAYVAFIVVGEFGQLWGVPQAVINLSPFVHSPILPGPDPNLGGLLWLTALTAMLLAAGTTAFRRRDLAP
jgi:ABC-2 type transport system permease protein